jgi:two-component system chemotaxis response regulator CheB
MKTRAEIVVVGASAGGLDAMSLILSSVPHSLDVPIVLVQHRSVSSDALCEVLQRHSRSPLREVTDKEPIEPGHVYVAPADYHLLIEPGHFALSVDPPEFYSRPSIDLALETAADAYGARAVGVVLTGANRDGARGLQHIVHRGGYAIVQDPATAEVPVMPAAALESVPTAEVVPLAELGPRLGRLGMADPSASGART